MTDILVAGSLNMDLAIKARRSPRAGETRGAYVNVWLCPPIAVSLTGPDALRLTFVRGFQSTDWTGQASRGPAPLLLRCTARAGPIQSKKSSTTVLLGKGKVFKELASPTLQEGMSRRGILRDALVLRWPNVGDARRRKTTTSRRC
jgi:hypothetical protein